MADYYFVDEELDLLKRIGFSEEVFQILKRAIVKEVVNLEHVIPERFVDHLLAYYPHQIEPLYANLPLHFQEKRQNIVGITIRGDVVANPEQFILDLNQQLYPLKYQSFLTVSSSASCTDDNISIIKGLDQLDLFKFIRLGSFSLEYITEEKIAEQVKALDQKYGLKIIGVGVDWLKLYFVNITENVDGLLEEIRVFAPDTFTWWGKETESEAYERIKKRFVEEHWVYLWWDD